MAYRDSLFVYTVDFETVALGTTNTLYFAPKITDSIWYDWDKSEASQELPTTLGDTFGAGRGAAYIDSNDSVYNFAQFCAPMNCRLQAIAWAFDFSSQDSNCTGIEIGIVKFGIGVGTARATDDTWTLMGYADTTDHYSMASSTTALVQSGVAYSESTHGNLDGGQSAAIMFQPKGSTSTDGTGYSHGIITLTFRAI